MQRRAVIFRGRVQGVGFRFATRAAAQGFAVTGWVRNEPDGSVRLEIQGDGPELDAVVQAIQKRMAGYIEDTRSEPMIPAHGEDGFGIRR